MREQVSGRDAGPRETRAKPSPGRRAIVLCRSVREHRMHSASPYSAWPILGPLRAPFATCGLLPQPPSLRGAKRPGPGAAPAEGPAPLMAPVPAQPGTLWEQAAGREMRAKPSPGRRTSGLREGGRELRMHPAGPCSAWPILGPLCAPFATCGLLPQPPPLRWAKRPGPGAAPAEGPAPLMPPVPAQPGMEAHKVSADLVEQWY